MAFLFGKKPHPKLDAQIATINYSVKLNIQNDGTIKYQLNDGTGFRKPYFLKDTANENTETNVSSASSNERTGTRSRQSSRNLANFSENNENSFSNTETNASSALSNENTETNASSASSNERIETRSRQSSRNLATSRPTNNSTQEYKPKV